MGVAVSCPRCGGPVRPPDLMHSDWRCDVDGAVLPLHVAQHIGPEIVDAVRAKLLAAAQRAGDRRPTPLWSPWPLPSGWMVTGVGWVGDERSGVHATALACSGPGPVEHGPADCLIIAEEPGVGLGNRFAGLPGTDPGPFFDGDLATTTAHAKVRAAGWPTPLWMAKSPEDRCAYIGEAAGMWIYIVTWPAAAGYLLEEELELHDLSDDVPTHLVYGAPSPYLHGKA
ncbi:DUF6758 family protein [Dactylosporangium sp. NPDC051484]|uniref:DUF6758 family protein n=1 Tax=Dactylosporangium sp. NPDC051484 TaxID=3154942 RepID=UPI00344B3C55